MSGRLIVLEGPDGSGTTTHAALLAQSLAARGESVVLTGEPTKSHIGLFIREQLKKKSIDSPSALQLMFCADRAWHNECVIKPALDAGKTVISDRYVISTLVYGEALGLDPEWLLQVNTPFIEPDLVIVALPDIDRCLQRVSSRQQLEVFEDAPFLRKVYDLYKRVTADDDSIVLIDTGGSKESVAAAILASVASRG